MIPRRLIQATKVSRVSEEELILDGQVLLAVVCICAVVVAAVVVMPDSSSSEADEEVEWPPPATNVKIDLSENSSEELAGCTMHLFGDPVRCPE